MDTRADGDRKEQADESRIGHMMTGQLVLFDVRRAQ